MSPYRDFFLHHSKLDIDRVAGAGNMDEFMTALKGNEFYAPLQSVYENGNGLLFDYGMALDLYYFNQIWSVRKKLFKGNDLDEITKAESAVYPAIQALLQNGAGSHLRTADSREL